MDKKEAFKKFIKSNPKLINYIKDNDSSMQKLYEIYDVYHTMRKWTIEDFREWLKNRAAKWETKIENNFNGKQGE